MINFIGKICAFLLSLSLVLNTAGNYDVENKDEIHLNVALISDTHLDTTLPAGKSMLTAGLNDIKCNATPNDAIVVAGDLTNYGDKKSVEDFYNILSEVNPAKEWIIAPGNHDIGHVENYSNSQARKWLINYNNKYTDAKNKNIYFSKTINNYTFIVLCDESKDNWDSCDISKSQIKFLDAQLKKATKKGRPAFVVCHWPMENTNGQKTIYEDSGLDGVYAKRVRKVLEKYDNVFFISGHMHKGLDNNLMRSLYDFSSIETINGVTYVNLPSYGSANRYGVPYNGYGIQMEVYKNEVVFRPRRYLRSEWYDSFEYRIPLTK